MMHPQEAADPGDLLGNAAQYVRDLGRDKTSNKADGFFDAMEARARKELAYWRSTVGGFCPKPVTTLIQRSDASESS